mgnify:CR=1 FL=1
MAGCGAQALGGALGRADGTDPQAAADALPWHDRGATPVDLLLAARAAGCDAELRAGTWEDLERVVAAQGTGIVMIDAAPEVRTLFSAFQTSPVMHWALVAGLARDGSEVLIGLPEDRVAIMDRAWFLDRWSRSDHCLIVVAAQREAMRNTSADARSIHAR